MNSSPPRRSETSKRLQELRHQRGASRETFANMLQINVKTLSAYERGDRKPSRKALEAYSKVGRVSIDWLLGGEDKSSVFVAENAKFGEQVNSGFMQLPVYSHVRASAGPGALNSEVEVTSAIAFDPQYLRDLGAKPSQCSVITAQGESMTPTIPDGALLVVDHSQISVEHGCIYVFNVSDRLVVKRARWSMDRTLTLISDNPSPDYPDERFNDDSADQLNVVGRVVFHGRRA